MSNFELNLAKTVFIPLWECSVEQVKRTIRNDLPQWARAIVSKYGTYLGLQVGPERVGTEWSKPIEKFLSRARLWSGLSLGLQYNARVYNTFVLTVLSYLW